MDFLPFTKAATQAEIEESIRKLKLMNEIHETALENSTSAESYCENMKSLVTHYKAEGLI